MLLKEKQHTFKESKQNYTYYDSFDNLLLAINELSLKIDKQKTVMLLPDKHITFAESILGLGTFILESLSVPKTVDNLWAEFEKVRGEKFPAYHSFDNLILAIDMLYAVGAIELSKQGQLQKCV